MGITNISFSCSVFNGSEYSTMLIYKDNILISDSFTLFISPASDDDFGTYTFKVSNPCGTDVAESKILQQCEFRDIAFCQAVTTYTLFAAAMFQTCVWI